MLDLICYNSKVKSVPSTSLSLYSLIDIRWGFNNIKNYEKKENKNSNRVTYMLINSVDDNKRMGIRPNGVRLSIQLELGKRDRHNVPCFSLDAVHSGEVNNFTSCYIFATFTFPEG